MVLWMHSASAAEGRPSCSALLGGGDDGSARVATAPSAAPLGEDDQVPRTSAAAPTVVVEPELLWRECSEEQRSCERAEWKAPGETETVVVGPAAATLSLARRDSGIMRRSATLDGAIAGL